MAGHQTRDCCPRHRAWQRPWSFPLVRGANHFLAAYVRTLAASLGSTHGNSRCVSPTGLRRYLFEVRPNMTSFFPNALNAAAFQEKSCSTKSSIQQAGGQEIIE